MHIWHFNRVKIFVADCRTWYWGNIFFLMVFTLVCSIRRILPMSMWGDYTHFLLINKKKLRKHYLTFQNWLSSKLNNLNQHCFMLCFTLLQWKLALTFSEVCFKKIVKCEITYIHKISPVFPEHRYFTNFKYGIVNFFL